MADFSIISDVSNEVLKLLRENICPELIQSPESIALAAPTDKNADFQLGLYLYDIQELREYQQQDMNYNPQQMNTEPTKEKIVAGLLAILIGTLGIHKFYLGYTKSGIIMLLVSLLTFGIGAPVMAVISLIEGILYLTKSDAEFYQTYVQNKKEWF
mgnify:CR=1 FL=1